MGTFLSPTLLRPERGLSRRNASSYHAPCVASRLKKSQAIFSTLERRWNAVQVRFRSEVAARGEVVISGLESFPYDNKALRRVLLHWGAFNAIAADNSGY